MDSRFIKSNIEHCNKMIKEWQETREKFEKKLKEQANENNNDSS